MDSQCCRRGTAVKDWARDLPRSSRERSYPSVLDNCRRFAMSSVGGLPVVPARGKTCLSGARRGGRSRDRRFDRRPPAPYLADVRLTAVRGPVAGYSGSARNCRGAGRAAGSLDGAAGTALAAAGAGAARTREFGRHHPLMNPTSSSHLRGMSLGPFPGRSTRGGRPGARKDLMEAPRCRATALGRREPIRSRSRCRCAMRSRFRLPRGGRCCDRSLADLLGPGTRELGARASFGTLAVFPRPRGPPLLRSTRI